MRFNVAELIGRAGRTRQREITLAPIHPTVGQERDLLRIYTRVLDAWGAAVRDRIMPAYTATLGDLVRDAPADPGEAINDADGGLNRLVLALGPALEDWTVRVERWHRGRFGQLFSATGVKLDTLLGQGDVAKTLEAVLGENTALIRSLSDQMRNGISGAVFRGLTQRETAASVAKEIRALTAVGKRRAELIAADQLQKLTGRLDQERQEQLGITEFEWAHSRKLRPRPEHQARDGKRYKWSDPVAKNDPPGRAIRCGCRARAVVDLEGEVANPVEPVAPPAPPPPPAPAKPEPPRFRSPINKDVTDATVRVQPRLALQKQLRGEFADAAEHPAYGGAQDNWGGRNAKDYGNASFSAAFDDETVSMIAALKPELDDLAKQIGIPPLRGFKSVSGGKAVANQGDGVMAINPGYFNGYASGVGGRSPTGALDAVNAQREALKAQMLPVSERFKALKAELDALGMRSSEWMAKYDELEAVRKEFLALREADEKLWKKASKLKVVDGKSLATWKPGDDVKARPFGTTEYFEGIDRGRNVLFHEFGHHVHQYLNKTTTRRMATPPLELELGQLFRQRKPDMQASKYANEDRYEWFAENFALFVMGKRELVDPILTELIERIFRREY